MQAVPERSTAGTSSQSLKPQRVLACVLCHQRKVKCDRTFPCSNCVKSRTECVPATITRRRARRRVSEQDLLVRLQRYEELLHHNNIKFDPLRNDPIHEDQARERILPTVESDYVSNDGQEPESAGTVSSTPSTTAKSERTLQYEAKNIWEAMNQRDPDSDDESNSSDDIHARQGAMRAAWDQLSGHNIFLILGSRPTPTPLSTLHPEPVQIFKFWQVYLDNANPLLKVIHAPSLQARIVEALGNLDSIDRTLEALMFSIYSVAVMTLSVNDCQALFGSTKDDLLRRYQFGSQQALLNCEFLRSRERDCVTALYLYIVSIRSSTDPNTLSCILAIAVRMARRLGCHSESVSARCTPFEAEMRRRLWWSLMSFDSRIGELSNSKSLSLDPTWDCRIPLNVNDSDLRPEMKEAPVAQEHCTDAVFAVVRGELGDCIRYSNWHLDFSNPVLKSIARHVQDAVNQQVGDLDALERKVEDQYLNLCDPEVPLHFITTWMTRAQIAKCRLLEYYSNISTSSNTPGHRISPQIETTIPYAFRMLECDTKIMRSPLTKGYIWMAEMHFPFPGYVHIVQELKRNPLSKHAEKAWETMGENFDARFSAITTHHTPLFKIFATAVLPAWETREAVARDSGEEIAPPSVVTSIKYILDQMSQDPQDRHTAAATSQPTNDLMNLDYTDLSMTMPMSFDSNSMLFDMGFDMGMSGQNGYASNGVGVYPSPYGQVPLDVDMNKVNWTMMNTGFHGQSG